MKRNLLSCLVLLLALPLVGCGFSGTITSVTIRDESPYETLVTFFYSPHQDLSAVPLGSSISADIEPYGDFLGSSDDLAVVVCDSDAGSFLEVCDDADTCEEDAALECSTSSNVPAGATTTSPVRVEMTGRRRSSS